MATRNCSGPNSAAPSATPHPVPEFSSVVDDDRDDLCRQVYEIESLLACVRARLESVLQGPEEHVLLPVDTVLRVVGDHVAALSESIEQALTTMQRLVPTPAPALEAAEA